MTRYTPDYGLPAPDGSSPVITSDDLWGLARKTEQSLHHAVEHVTDVAENAILSRMPEIDDADILAVVTDASGRHTFMAARSSDGSPTGHAARLIAHSQGDHSLIGGEYLWALTDSSGQATDLTVRASDGQFPDWVIDRLSSRINQRTGNGQKQSDRWVHPSGEVVPMHVDMSKWSAWGSSGIDRMSTELSTIGANIGVPYYNGGKGGERYWHTEARLGSAPAELVFPNNVIPGDTTDVDVTAANVPPLSAMRWFTGTVAGVHGTLKSTDETLQFARTEPGDPVAVEPGTPFIPTYGHQYRESPALLQLGKNNITLEPDSAPGVIESHHRAFDWFAPIAKRVLVIGHHANRDWTEDSTTLWNRLTDVNDALRERYGALFFDLQAWMTSPEVWTATGISPTQDDLSAQELGAMPPSLSADALHFNTTMNVALAHQIQTKFQDLEWY